MQENKDEQNIFIMVRFITRKSISNVILLYPCWNFNKTTIWFVKVPPFALYNFKSIGQEEDSHVIT